MSSKHRRITGFVGVVIAAMPGEQFLNLQRRPGH